jgi:ferrous iron transport protein B
MSQMPERATIRVALFGNPNTGKSTLFSALAGVAQRVGNYPGVTVDKKVARTEYQGRQFVIVDLPGTYSLAPRSPDEMVSVDVLLGRARDEAAPDVIVCVVDASHIERNLYLVSQALELGQPLIVALNKSDIAEDHGVHVDVAELSHRLGVPVVETQAHRQVGLDQLKRCLLDVGTHGPPAVLSCFPQEFQREVAQLSAEPGLWANGTPPRYLVERVLLDTSGYLQGSDFVGDRQRLSAAVRAARERLEAVGCRVPTVETTSRYRWVDEILDGALRRTGQQHVSWTDRMDRLLTHRIAGSVIFLGLMIVVFQSIFSWAGPVQDAIENAVSWSGSVVGTWLPAGALRSLIVDGVIAGVGAVLVFLPQIAILFFFIAVLEDCGYMARAAYLTDGLMSRIGLSGKSFIPLLSSFACAVPGIMAARVIEDRRDRLVTILVAPLMSCSARLPVYTLLIAAFIPDWRWLGGWLGLRGMLMFALYCSGIVAAILAAKVFKMTLLRGDTPPFVMELPDYRFPTPRVVASRLVDRCWSFVRNAGTLILAVTVLVWAAGYFPRHPELEAEVRQQFAAELDQLDRQLAASQSAEPQGDEASSMPRSDELARQRELLESELENRVASVRMEQSLLGHAGRWIEPVVKPLGWDWRIGCAVMASFPAREVVIGAMGVIFNMGDAAADESPQLQQRLRQQTWPDSDRPLFTIPATLSLLVFFALCAQCGATLITIRRETQSLGWAAFTFCYMTALAYLAALMTYQLGTHWMA